MKGIITLFLLICSLMLSACNDASIGVIGGADGPTSIFVGSNGLGLSMVKSIIELHGEDITVKSSLGHGTEFRIVL